MQSDIAENITSLRARLDGTGAQLVAVSKYHPVPALRQAYDAGQRIFGENRVQELLSKIPEMPDDVCWHLIGHLQTNKVRAITGKTALIESVDSEKLLNLIDKEAERAGVVTRVLMQIHVAQEESKTGFLPDELLDYFHARRYENLKATHICGVMGMATNTDDTSRIRDDFRKIREAYEAVRAMCPDLSGFDTISMGMSGDWPIAIEEGSTLIRGGSAIFGPREY